MEVDENYENDNNIINSTKNENNEVDKDAASQVKESMEVDENYENDNNKEETEKAKNDEKSPSEKEKKSDGSNSDPINIEEDTDPKETNDEASKLNEARSIFKNISISVVGGKSRNINLESFLTAKPPPAAPKPTTKNFPTGPNISIKRKSATSPTNIFDGKRAKKSPIIVTSSDEDSIKEKSVPTVTLDEELTIGEINEDDDDPKPKENLAAQYDNCTHGDPTDYMCVDCTYNRWRCEWDFVRPRRVKKAKKTTQVKVIPQELMKAVNWEKVFKFAGVGVKEEIKIE